MNPSPQAIASIQAKITDWTQADSVILAALNAATITNPTSQASLPVLMNENVMATLLTDPTNNSASKLINWPNYGLLQTDILANDYTRVGAWAEKLAAVGIITAGESTAILDYLGTPILDASWQPLISWAQANLGRPVDEDDLTAARPTT